MPLKRSVTIRAALIAGIFAVLAALIGAFALLIKQDRSPSVTTIIITVPPTQTPAPTPIPQHSIVGEKQATFVGEITDDGGDPNLEVWFEYGETCRYGSETTHYSKYGRGLFSTTVYNLEPCTTYHYRAVGKNSAGTTYGEDKTFTTVSSLSRGKGSY
jgi:hypothetical protein